MTFTVKIALFVLLCSAVTLAARAPQATLTVRVVDPAEGPITDALVVIHLEPPYNQLGRRHDGLTRLKLDAATAAFRRGLPAGDYDLFVAAAGFYPSCRKVHLLAGETNAIKMTLKIENVATVVTPSANSLRNLSRPQL